MSRADDMHRTLSLAPGMWFSRKELFHDAGAFYLTNNAASEVRAKYGGEVEHKLIDGTHCYRLNGGGGAFRGSPPGACTTVTPSVEPTASSNQRPDEGGGRLFT